MITERWFVMYDYNGAVRPYLAKTKEPCAIISEQFGEFWLNVGVGDTAYLYDGIDIDIDSIFAFIPEPERNTYYELNEDQIKLVKGYLAL